MSKTIRVRIAVAVNADKDWNATGWNVEGSEVDDKTKVDTALDAMPTSAAEHVVFVEAEVPLPPSVETIEGEVKE